MAPNIKVGDKVYVYSTVESSKAKADKKAAELRKKGYAVQIRKRGRSSNILGWEYYAVYKRKI